MTLSAEWRAVQLECQLAAEQIASGVTSLGKANHAQTGLYAQAFFGLSTGMERLGKLVLVASHAIENGGKFPPNRLLRDVGHDLRKLLQNCDEIGRAYNKDHSYFVRPNDAIHASIVDVLADFAERTRYYNLDFLTDNSGGQMEPINRWWREVAMPLCDRHYSQRQQARDAALAKALGEAMAPFVMVVHHTETGTPIDSMTDLLSRGGATKVTQRFGRLYVLQIVRWLSTILADLSHRGGYGAGIEALLGMNEPFVLFFNEDSYLLSRKTWSIYRL